MKIKDVARAVEFTNSLEIAENRLARMELIAAYTTPTHIVFYSSGQQARIDDDDLDSGVWYQAVELVIQNLKVQVARHKAQIDRL